MWRGDFSCQSNLSLSHLALSQSCFCNSADGIRWEEEEEADSARGTFCLHISIWVLSEGKQGVSSMHCTKKIMALVLFSSLVFFQSLPSCLRNATHMVYLSSLGRSNLDKAALTHWMNPQCVHPAPQPTPSSDCTLWLPPDYWVQPQVRKILTNMSYWPQIQSTQLNVKQQTSEYLLKVLKTLAFKLEKHVCISCDYQW